MSLLQMLPRGIRIAAGIAGPRLLQMSISGAFIILTAVVVRSLALYKLPKKGFLAMWGVALARLLIPFTIPSSYSVFSLFDRYKLVLLQPSYVPDAVSPPVGIPATAPSARPPVQSLDMTSLLAIIWLAGVVTGATFFLVMYVRCRREFQMSIPIESQYIAGWLEEHSLKRPLAVRQSGQITAPVSYGLFRPVILLPKTLDLENENVLQFILAHEYVHIRRLDAATKGIILLALCVHWFNPLVWVMYILANRDIELTCDEAVIRQLGQETRAGYAKVLIDMVESKLGMTPLGNHFSRTAIEERIVAIVKSPKASTPVVALDLLLVACTTVAFATSSGSGGAETPPILTGQEEWIGEYQKLVSCQAAVDYVNGEKMSVTYLLDRQTYMESYVPPDRGMPIAQAIAALEQSMNELEPEETRHFWLNAWDGSSIEVYAQPDYRIEICAANGDPLATLTSASYEWEYHYTEAERQFAKESDAVYLEAYRDAERAGITEAKEPPFSVGVLSSDKYYFGSQENIQRMAAEIQARDSDTLTIQEELILNRAAALNGDAK